MTGEAPTARYIPHHAGRDTVTGATAVEWYAPTSPDDRWDGSSTFSAQPQHDAVTGEIFMRVQVGDTFAYFKPATLREAAQRMYVDTLQWQECHQDLELDACISKTCRFTPGRGHIGRLTPWERTRTRRIVGESRNPEILRLDGLGLSRQKIAWRIGWSESTVARVIRESVEAGDVSDVRRTVEVPSEKEI